MDPPEMLCTGRRERLKRQAELGLIEAAVRS